MDRRSLLKKGLLFGVIPSITLPLVGSCKSSSGIPPKEDINPEEIVAAVNWTAITTFVKIAFSVYSIFNKPKEYDPTIVILEFIKQLSEEIKVVNDKIDLIISQLKVIEELIGKIPQATVDLLTQRQLQGALTRYSEEMIAYQRGLDSASNKPRYYRNYLTQEKKEVLSNLLQEISQFSRQNFPSRNLFNVPIVTMALYAEYDLLRFLMEDENLIKTKLEFYRNNYLKDITLDATYSAQSNLKVLREKRIDIMTNLHDPRSYRQKVTFGPDSQGPGQKALVSGAYNFKLTPNDNSNKLEEIQFLLRSDLINVTELFYTVKVNLRDRVLFPRTLHRTGEPDIITEWTDLGNNHVHIPRIYTPGYPARGRDYEDYNHNLKKEEAVVAKDLYTNTNTIMIAAAALGAGKKAIEFCDLHVS